MAKSTGSFLQFLGAAETVTGSKHLIQHRGRQILLDCGLFQGLKSLRKRNWEEPTYRPSEIDVVVLSHAHIDHCGYLPLLTRRGFRGPIYCTSATEALVRIALLDSARLQEEEAHYANRAGYSKHQPAQPLYTVQDAKQTLQLLESRRYGEPFSIDPNATVQLRHTGHILGSASIQVNLTREKGEPIRVLFSGDVGRWNRPILKDPVLPTEADYLILESTYGGRTHSPEGSSSQLARIVNDTVERKGVLVVPAFAVGRTQELMWHFLELENAKKIPSLPIYIDSPMATSVSMLYCQHLEEHDMDLLALTARDGCMFESRRFQYVTDVEDSKQLNRMPGPAIVISASGMATGGRILHHLKHRLPDRKNTVLLVGFQAEGTRGRLLQDGAKFIRIHGQDVPVRAEVASIGGLSAHADHGELMRWLERLQAPPKKTYTVHGEPEACQNLAAALRQKGWDAEMARDGEVVPIG